MALKMQFYVYKQVVFVASGCTMQRKQANMQAEQMGLSAALVVWHAWFLLIRKYQTLCDLQVEKELLDRMTMLAAFYLLATIARKT